MSDNGKNSDEMAKAIQAAANAAGKGIDAAARLGNFLHSLCGDGLAELGRAFHDWARVFRYGNRLTLQDKVERIRRAREMEGRPVPMSPRYLVLLLQNASLEDDDDVQQLWAGLIANATDPNIRQETGRVFINILSSIDPLDAIVMRYVHDDVPRGSSIDADVLADHIQTDVSALMLSLSNLSRLGCFDYTDETGGSYLVGGGFSNAAAPSVQFPGHYFRITPLADALLRACAVSR